MTFAKYQSFTLDGVGNRTTVDENGVPAPYLPNVVNEYTAVNGIARVHDTNGNLSDDGTNLYKYDFANRLIEAWNKATSTLIARYTYDALGRRVTKYVAGTSATSIYVYDGDQIIEERNSADALQKRFTYGILIDEPVEVEIGVNKYYYHLNNLGSVYAITDATGVLIERYEYDAYGKPTIFDNLGQQIPSSMIGNFYMFTGRQFDAETGLYYYRARYYDSVTGRFLQRDPLGYVDGMGLYEYVISNPIKYTDSSGLAAYKKGRLLPPFVHDEGAGVHGSQTATYKMLAVKAALTEAIVPIWKAFWPDAAKHLEHYLKNSGLTYKIDMDSFVKVKSERVVMQSEIDEAKKYVETLSEGTTHITSSKWSGGYVTKEEDKNWYYAMAGYSACGKGIAKVEYVKDVIDAKCDKEVWRFSLDFTYVVKDRYNWDGEKSVTINLYLKKIKVTDKFMGDLHRQGLAKEFNMYGVRQLRTIIWFKQISKEEGKKKRGKG